MGELKFEAMMCFQCSRKIAMKTFLEINIFRVKSGDFFVAVLSMLTENDI